MFVSGSVVTFQIVWWSVHVEEEQIRMQSNWKRINSYSISEVQFCRRPSQDKKRVE